MAKQRIASLDVLRTFAILTVLLVHCTEASWQMNYSLLQVGGIERMCVFSLFIVGRFGVPIFLFLTGYLLLDRDYTSKDAIQNFYKKHLLPLFITCAIWFVVYFFLYVYIKGNPVILPDLISQIFFLETTQNSSFWYIPMILGIYIFIPFVAILLKNIRDRWLIFPGIVCFIYLFVVPVISMWQTVNGSSIVFQSLPDLQFGGGVYGFMLVLGYLIKRHPLKIKRSIWLIVAIVCLIVMVWMQNQEYWASFNRGVEWINCNVWYANAILLIAVFAVFQFFLQAKHIPCKNLFKWVSERTFGIYLAHNVFRVVLIPLFENLPSWQEMLILYTLTLAGSIVFVWLVSLNKKVSKILIYK